MKIPFKTISFKPNLASWGINVERYIARKQETDRLSGTTSGIVVPALKDRPDLLAKMGLKPRSGKR